MTDRRSEKARKKATGSPGLRALRRPAAQGSPEFDLAYTRTGPSDGCPSLFSPADPDWHRYSRIGNFARGQPNTASTPS